MTATRTAPAAGDIRTWDYQADCFGGQYRLVEDLGAGTWLCEHLPPSDETVDAIVALAAEHEARGFSYLGTVDELMDEVDHAVLEFSKRLTVAQYRVLRDGVRQFRETIAANAQLSAVYPPGTTMGDLLPSLPPAQ